MASLTWEHASTVGIPSMDDQHAILMDAFSELRLALLHGAENSAVRTQLARVSRLTRLHIESEERLLALHQYPDLAAHHSEHQRLLARLSLFDIRYEQRHSGSVYELVEYLRKWFTTHTGVSGQKYGPWLQKCGVQ